LTDSLIKNVLVFSQVNNKELLHKDNITAQNDEHIKMFWVGLMDGDGSIQVNHWRKKSLQFRLVIKLSNIISNYDMLIKIALVIGGSVRITGKGLREVIWVVNKKETVIEIIKIFDTYPLLTSRKICQLLFLKRCLLENSVDFYLLNRENKYTNQKDIIKYFSTPVPLYSVPCSPVLVLTIKSTRSAGNPAPLRSQLGGLKGGKGDGRANTECLNISFYKSMLFSNYFKSWLSGFIEAEGCFSIRKNNNHSFSIGQNYDFYLINRIKEYTKSTNIVRNPYGNFYSLEIYKKETLKQIINHFYYYPLLGEKAESLKRFNQIIQL